MGKTLAAKSPPEKSRKELCFKVERNSGTKTLKSFNIKTLPAKHWTIKNTSGNRKIKYSRNELEKTDFCTQKI